MRSTRLGATIAALVVAASIIPPILAQGNPKPLCNKDLYSEAEVEDGRLVVHGTPVPYIGGNITTYLVLKNDTGCGSPQAVGIELALNLTALPGPTNVSMPSPPQCQTDPFAPGCPPPMDEFVIDFPGASNSSFTPFKWMGLNYNPLGHPPVNVFNARHFDLHFWMADKSVKDQITLGTPPNVCTEGVSPEAFFTAHEPIPAECFPEGLANLNAVAPFMGNHIINIEEPVVAAALKGSPDPNLWVEPSFISGVWNGTWVFLEPMVRLSYMEDILKNATKTCFTPILPPEYSEPGFYPTQYCVDGTTPGVIRVEMDNFELQEQPGCTSTNYAPMSYITAMPPPPGAPPLPEFCKAPLPKGAAGPGPAPAPTPGKSPVVSPSASPKPPAVSPGASPAPSPPSASAPISIGLSAIAAAIVAIVAIV